MNTKNSENDERMEGLIRKLRSLQDKTLANGCRIYFKHYTGSENWKTLRQWFMHGMTDRLNARLAELTAKRSVKPPMPKVEAGAEADAPPSYELMVLKERNVAKAFEGLKM